MRIPQIAAMFTILFITHGECRPDTNTDYQNDPDEYDTEETGEMDNRYTPEVDTPDAHILSSPRKILVHLGDNVHLPCNVSNAQEVLVLWKKGVTPLYHDNIPDIEDPVERSRIVRHKDNSLSIYNFKDSDVSDEYICEITSNPPEKIVHSVRTSRNVLVLPSETVRVNEPNKSITLACQADWEPKPIIKWSYKGKRLSSDSYPRDGSSLTIHNVSEDNAGLYQCLVEASNGEPPSLYAIHVIAYHAPKIEIENEKVHTGIHMDTELTCQVDAYPQAEVTWLKDDKKVTVGMQNKIELPNQPGIKHTLAFTRVEKSDFGKYTCQARNQIGNASQTIELTGSPRAAKFLRAEVTKDGEVPILEWELESFSPIIKYELEYRLEDEKNWQIVSPRVSDDGTGNIFKIRYPLEGLKAGNYEAVLIAQNEFGWSPRPSESVKFRGENIIPAEPDVAGSKSGASSSTQALILLRSLLLAVSILVSTTYL